MPRITSIKQQKKSSRVNVYLDGKFGFGIDLDNFVKLGLRVEQELSQDQIDKITKRAQTQKSYNKLLRFATLRPRSKKEIVGWLKKHKVSENVHKDMFNKLKRLDLLDDTKFATWWVEQRMAFRPKSKRELTHELRQKGIDRTLIEETVDKAEIDEGKVAKRLVEKKLYKWEKLEGRAKAKKISEFLGRRGFGWDTAKGVVDDFVKKE